MHPAPAFPLRRRRRTVGAAVGAAALAALALSGAGTSARAMSPSGSPAARDCATAGSLARVAAGHAGVDPNSVTPAEAAALEQKITAAQAQGLTARGTDGSTIKIRTFVHVITAKDGTGAVSGDQIRRQIAVINAGFAGRTAPSAAASPFRFVVARVDVTRNDAWYNWTVNDDGTETADAIHAKRALHRGGWADLNVYITGLGSGLLGYATFPDEGPLKLDGLVILNESMPGGDAAPYNLGDTATHEIGHWLGLFHTFENGCNPPGDYVRDTPYQDDGDNIFYCGDWPGDGDTRHPDDTCPQPGKDPVHNFMSYGDDPCLDRFTPGQVSREIRTWYALRAGR